MSGNGTSRSLRLPTPTRSHPVLNRQPSVLSAMPGVLAVPEPPRCAEGKTDGHHENTDDDVVIGCNDASGDRQGYHDDESQQSEPVG